MNAHKINALSRLMRWHQLAGFYLILPSCLWGLIAAYNNHPDFEFSSTLSLLFSWVLGQGISYPNFTGLIIIFIVGSLIMRSAGCIINDFWDIDIDPQVERTKSRPLASGELSKGEAIGLFITLIVLASFLVLLLNPRTGLLALLGVAGTIAYPLAKRHIKLPQLVLGLVFSWGTIMAWSAIAIDLSFSSYIGDPWLLWLANILWILSYDLQYALCDIEDDKKIGINSGALYFMDKTPQVIILLQIGLIMILVGRGLLLTNGVIYFIMLGAGALLFAYFYSYTKGYTDRAKCLTSFRENHWFGWLVLVGITLET